MVCQLLETLNRLGVGVRVVAGDRIRLEPASKIPADLLPRIRKAKPEIIAALRNGRPATCAASCYQVEPGRWIHHPWDGCTTGKAEAEKPQRQVQVECWHCRGERKCGCITCWHGRPGDCAACRGTGQLLRWVQ